MAKRDRHRQRNFQPSFERLEPRHMLSLSAVLLEAFGGQPPTIVIPRERLGEPPVLEQPYFPEPESPAVQIPTLAKQAEVVRLTLNYDGYSTDDVRNAQCRSIRDGSIGVSGGKGVTNPEVGPTVQLPLDQRSGIRRDETPLTRQLPHRAVEAIETRIKGVFESSESLWKEIRRIFS